MGAGPAAAAARADRGAALSAAGAVAEPLPGSDALLAASGGDPFVAAEAPGRCWAGRGEAAGAVAFVRRSPVSRRSSLAVLGPAAPAAALAVDLLAGGARDVAGLTVPVDALPLVAARTARRLRGGACWDWLATAAPPPPVPGEDGVARLPDDTATRAELTELLAAASPRRSAEPGDAHVRGWWGVRDAGRLVAAGAWSEHVAGVPHLESVATVPQARGRGHGAAVVAVLTREALAAAPRCTLGLYADNDVARRLYHRLGYRTHHRFASRAVVRAAVAPPAT